MKVASIVWEVISDEEVFNRLSKNHPSQYPSTSYRIPLGSHQVPELYHSERAITTFLTSSSVIGLQSSSFCEAETIPCKLERSPCWPNVTITRF